MMAPLILLTRGQRIECPNPIFRPAVRPVRGGKRKSPVMPASIVADFPRRRKRPRGCKVATPAGEFLVTATPHPDRMIRLEGGNIEAVAEALGIAR